jgi:uncharacterized protein (DUF2141 family)
MKRALVLAALPLLGTAAAPPSGSLTVRITNVRNSTGDVHVDVCPEASFLKDDCAYAASAPAHIGTTIVTVHGLPPGQYAVQAFHDENRNHKVDRALFGIPKEGIGFSNDAPIHFGPPKWADARITLNGGNEATTLKMRYMLGASGPQ